MRSMKQVFLVFILLMLSTSFISSPLLLRNGRRSSSNEKEILGINDESTGTNAILGPSDEHLESQRPTKNKTTLASHFHQRESVPKRGIYTNMGEHDIQMPISSPQESTSSSDTYWVDAGASGNGEKENPAGNITWVLQNRVAENDIINVKRGTYNSSIGETFPLRFSSSSNVTLQSVIGSANTVIQGSEWENGIEITMQNITIRGFKIEGVGDNAILLDGGNHSFIEDIRIKEGCLVARNTWNSSFNANLLTTGQFNLDNSGANKIVDNTLKEGADGLCVTSGKNNILKRNTIKQSEWEAIEMKYTSGNNLTNNLITKNGKGIRLENCMKNRIAYNTITENSGASVRLLESSENNITTNYIVGGWECVSLEDADENTISENTVLGDTGLFPIKLKTSRSNVITHNNITLSQDDGITLRQSSNGNLISWNTISHVNNEGIDLSSSSNNVITNNFLSHSAKFDIRLEYSDSNTVTKNTIEESTGLAIYESENNLVYLNNFLDEDIEIEVSCDGNNFSDSEYGNYWAAYSGNDENRNGIGDSSYQVAEEYDDRYPLMIPWQSPFTIGIAYPNGGVKESTVTVSWFYYNETPIDSSALFLDGNKLLNESSTSYTLTNLNVSETYLVNVTAYDSLGHIESDVVQFTVDFSSPSISIMNPTPGTSFRKFNVDVSWEGSDSGSGIASYNVRIDDEPWIPIGDTTSYNFTGLSKGNHTVVVKAKDYADNVATQSVKFQIVYPEWNVFVGCASSYISYQVRIEGNLTWGNKDMNGKLIVMQSNRTGLIANIRTGDNGVFSLLWEPTVSGTYQITFTWKFASYVVTLGVTPQQKERVFSVISNSTVRQLAFNSTSKQLQFRVEGVTGTKGYVNVTIDKEIVSNASEIEVYLDGEDMNYSVDSLGDSWLLHFTYNHSSHQVNIGLNESSMNQGIGEFSNFMFIAIGAGIGGAVAAVGFGITAFYFVRKTANNP